MGFPDLILAAVLPAVLAVPAPAAPPGPGDSGATAGTRRLIERQDFEDPAKAPGTLPGGWVRDDAPGWSKYIGTVTPTNEHAASGDWSLAFDMRGQSMGFRLLNQEEPIQPLADYAVSVRVRTRDLAKAGARLTAWFYDEHGRILETTRRSSDVVRTGGSWETLFVQLPGTVAEAVDLGVRLEVVQPEAQDLAPGPAPMLRDARGFAWFDDLQIWREPRITIQPAGGALVFTPSNPPVFAIQVRDLTNETLTAALRVHDLDGDAVFTRHFPAPRSRRPAEYRVPITRFGWYRAEIEIATRDVTVGRGRLDFAVLPDETVRRAGLDPRWSVALRRDDTAPMLARSALCRALHTGGVSVPLERHGNDAELRPLIDDLLAAGVEVTFDIPSTDRPQDNGLGALPPARVNALLVDYGLRVRQWLFGADPAYSAPATVRDVAVARARLGRSVPDPEIIVADDPDRRGPVVRDATVWLDAPSEILPESLPEYVRAWSPERPAVVRLRGYGEESLPPHERALDMMLRGLTLWRERADRLVIDAPWSWSADTQHAVLDPSFAVWRGLADALGRRRFAGTLDLGPGLHAWLLAGERAGDDALVVWRDGLASDAPQDVTLPLARGYVRLLDVFGNGVEIARGPNGHTLPVRNMPHFVEGIDLPLTLFGATARFEPAVVPAEHRAHDVQLVLRNTWNLTVSGTVTALDEGVCLLEPRRREFTLGPGAEARLPFTLAFDRTIVAGAQTIPLLVEIEADRGDRLELRPTLVVDWPGLRLSAHWTLTRDAGTDAIELLVTQVVHNEGNDLVDLDAFLFAPGEPHQVGTIGRLAPGAAVARTFSLTGDPTRFSGATLRLGVSEHDGDEQVSQLLVLPNLDGLEPSLRSNALPARRTVSEDPG